MFAIPRFDGKGLLDANQLPAVDETLTLKSAAPAAVSVKLLSDGKALESSYSDGTISVQLPANRRSKLIDVVDVELGSAK